MPEMESATSLLMQVLVFFLFFRIYIEQQENEQTKSIYIYEHTTVSGNEPNYENADAYHTAFAVDNDKMGLYAINAFVICTSINDQYYNHYGKIISSKGIEGSVYYRVYFYGESGVKHRKVKDTVMHADFVVLNKVFIITEKKQTIRSLMDIKGITIDEFIDLNPHIVSMKVGSGISVVGQTKLAQGHVICVSGDFQGP